MNATDRRGGPSDRFCSCAHPSLRTVVVEYWALERDLGAMGAGSHAVSLSETRTLPNGVYFLRVLQGSLSSGTRLIVQH